MSLGNLERLLRPATVAVIGASERPGSVGATLLAKLLKAGFQGALYPVNPKYAAVQGLSCYPSVARLPEVPDLALVATPPRTLPGLIRALGGQGVGAAVLMAGRGGWPIGRRGQALTRRLLSLARPRGVRLLGPNSLGLMVPALSLDASLAPSQPRSGKVAFVAQSGAVTATVLGWAEARGLGFSQVLALGDTADVGIAEVLDYLAGDPGCEAVLLYLESVGEARRFISAARSAARVKPVIVLKAGRHEDSEKAARTHTGVLASRDAVYDAVFQRAGLLRVNSLHALFGAVEALSSPVMVRGDRVAILGNGGGPGVLATDALVEAGGRLASLTPTTRERLRRAGVVEGAVNNPINLATSAPGMHYEKALGALLEDPGVDAVAVLNTPTALTSAPEAAQGVVAALGERTGTVFAAWSGSVGLEESQRLFARRGIPCFNTPVEGVRALMTQVRFRRNRELLMQTPRPAPGFEPDRAAARGLLKGRQGWLDGATALALLAAYGVPAVATRLATGPVQAQALTGELNGPWCLKLDSPDILHKAAAGAVALGLETPHQLRAEAEFMSRRLAIYHPNARLRGFIVQPMVRRPEARELILGMTVDPQFGPVLLFGQGGTATELHQDVALALPPLNLHLARELMTRTRVSRLLEAYGEVAAADLEAVALVLVRLSRLVEELAEVVELEINPLLADADGVLALDARVRVVPSRASAASRLAIRPYPRELEESITLASGQRLKLRPIRPEDEPALRAGFGRLSPEEVRLRFMHRMNELTHAAAARLTQIDYDREMALVLIAKVEGEPAIVGVVRLFADPDGTRAEFAIIVWRPYAGQGLGALLMRRIIQYARDRGIRELFGSVLRDNDAMLALARGLGFREEPDPEEPGLRQVVLELR